MGEAKTESEEVTFSPGDEIEEWYLVLQSDAVSAIILNWERILAHIPMTPDVDW